MTTGVGKWREGRPSEPGWYNASIVRDGRLLRWFNGRRWSTGVTAGASLLDVMTAARTPHGTGYPQIEWRPLRKDLRR